MEVPESVVCCPQTADFGPRTALKIVDSIRDKVKAGKIEKGDQIRTALKDSITELLQKRGGNTDLRLGQVSPAVVLVVGVNGGGKTTSIGKLAHKFTSEGASVRWTELVEGAAVHCLGQQFPAGASASCRTVPCRLPTAFSSRGWSCQCSSLHLEEFLVAWAGCSVHSVRPTACDLGWVCLCSCLGLGQ